jgi:hypothetical protein
MYSLSAINFLNDTLSAAVELADEENPDGQYGTISIVTILSIFSALAPLLGNICKKPIPEPTPIPASLAAVGVANSSWVDAWRAHHISLASYENGRYAPAVLNQAIRKTKASQGVNRRTARPLAIASLDSARTSTPEVIAMTVHGMKMSGQYI